MRPAPIISLVLLTSLCVVARATGPSRSLAYRAKLGLERAERYLVASGIAGARVQTVSDGSEDASPRPKDWPTDRRVGVQLAP